MPWSVKDVDRFKQGLTPGQKRKWVEIANGALSSCRLRNGDDCEAYAIRTANSKVGISEATGSHGRHVDTTGGTDVPDNECETEESQSRVVEMQTSESGGVMADLEFLVPLTESQISRDGVATVKVIEPGWGSSGYYKPEVLERDSNVFEGVQMFWDHPRKSDQEELPERSLNDLAGVLHGVHWDNNGKDGPGIYGNAKIFSPFKERMKELAPYVGLSILASGKLSEGEFEGRRGPVIESITKARSVDFVTVAGAGGKVVSLFESLRDNPLEEEVQDNMDEEVKRLQESISAKDTELSEVKSKLADVEAKLSESELELARYRETDLLRESKEHIESKISDTKMPDLTKSRIVETLSSNPPVKDGKLDVERLDKNIDEAVKAEAEYLAKVFGSGKIRYLGGPEGPDGANDAKVVESKLQDAFTRMGLSEEEVKIAASGR